MEECLFAPYQLSDEQRQILTARHEENATYLQIGQRLGCSSTDARVCLVKAEVALRQIVLLLRRVPGTDVPPWVARDLETYDVVLRQWRDYRPLCLEQELVPVDNMEEVEDDSDPIA